MYTKYMIRVINVRKIILDIMFTHAVCLKHVFTLRHLSLCKHHLLEMYNYRNKTIPVEKKRFYSKELRRKVLLHPRYAFRKVLLVH